MPHSVSLISTIAASLGLALVFGFLAVRLKLPPLLGYLVAGIAVGPFSPGFVANTGLAVELAEIGVILLMFGVGLHFSFRDLLSVKGIALPGALVQIALATAMGTGLAMLWGWSAGAGMVFGLAMSVASTVVLLRALEDRGLLDSVNGRIAVGWLVVEDLAMVLVLVLLPPLASQLGGNGTAAAESAGGGIWMQLAWTLGKVALFMVLMLVMGRRLFPWILWQVARTGSRELFTLCVVAAAVGVAYGSAELFGVSFALGAFFAGMVLRESDLSHRAAEQSLPLRDAFSVLFFVSVGMLFNPKVLVEHPFHVLAVVAIIIIGKSLGAFFIVLAFRYPLNTALTVSASLAQIGEFSFILITLGKSLGLLPEYGQSLILAGALISIAVNPLVFKAVEPARNWMRARSRFARGLERSADPLAELPASVQPGHVTGHVVLVGYDGVGRGIAEELARLRQPCVVLEQNREAVERLRAGGARAVAGDPADPAALVQAHVARARVLVIAAPEAFDILKILETARALNPDIETVVCTNSPEHAALLRAEKVGKVFEEEQELALGMARYVMERMA